MRLLRIATLAALGASFALARPGAASSANWPGWRGPDTRGVSDDANVPTEWSPTVNIAWKTAIPGRGHSSPIVWGDRLFVTTAIEGEVVEGARPVVHIEDGQVFVHPDSVGGDRRHAFKVFALDAGTGRVLWERSAHDGTVYDDRHTRGSYAAPTPITDGRRVYAYFGAEGVYAYDFDGRLIWKSPVGGIATFGMGTGTSPVLHGDLLILQCDEDTGERSFVVALDKTSGREVWRTARPVQASWSTRAAGCRRPRCSSRRWWRSAACCCSRARTATCSS